VACPEIPACLKRGQGTWAASFFLLPGLWVCRDSTTVQIRKITKLREIRKRTAAFRKKDDIYQKRAFCTFSKLEKLEIDRGNIGTLMK
jgi:hypothetical protein